MSTTVVVLREQFFTIEGGKNEGKPHSKFDHLETQNPTQFFGDVNYFRLIETLKPWTFMVLVDFPIHWIPKNVFTVKDHECPPQWLFYEDNSSP